MKLYLSNRNLTSLVGLIPNRTTILYCFRNQLTSLEGCPDSVTKLYCSNNQLTSLEGCPDSVTELDCYGDNNLDLYLLPDSVTKLVQSSYKGVTLDEIREINKQKKRSLTTKLAKKY